MLSWLANTHFVEQAQEALHGRLALTIAVAEQRVGYTLKVLRNVASNSITLAAVAGEDIQRTALPYFNSIAIHGLEPGNLHLLDYRGRPLISSDGGQWVAPDDWDQRMDALMAGRTVVQPFADAVLVGLPVDLGFGPEAAVIARLQRTDLLSDERYRDVEIEVLRTDRTSIGDYVTRLDGGRLTGTKSAEIADVPGMALVAKASAPVPAFWSNPDQSGLLAALAAVLAVAVASIWMAASSLTAPIKRLASDLKERGLEVRSAGRGAPLEVEILTQGFIDAARDVEQALETERAAARKQREFVSMVSHEFRTPLAIIHASADALRRRAERMPIEKREDKYSKIISSVARLIRLMESMLIAHRLDADGFQLELIDLDLRGLLEKLCDEQRTISASARITLDAASLPTSIRADERLMTTVVSNLLSNAVKYGGQPPEVTVRGSTLGDMAFVEVTDNGVGIPQDQLKRIGERYFRASTSTGIAGTGVGLNMVKQVLAQHGGTLRVESEVGRGSVFSFVLPIAGPEAVPA